MKYKMKYRPRRYAPAAGTEWSKDQYNEHQAKQYARWLAQRNGITLPHLQIRIIWSGFYSAFQKRNVRYRDGTHEQPAFYKRIKAVEWGSEREVFNQRKDERRGAWSHNEWDPEVRINIPNWDFEPAPPVDESSPRACAHNENNEAFL